MGMDKATGVSLFACMVIYILCGLSGYFYGVSVEEIQIIPGDCLKMYPSSIDVTIARSCLEALFKATGWLSQDGFTPWQFSCEIITYVACTLAVAMVVTELDAVLGIVGSIAAIPFMFVFPGLLQM